jgi:pyruvate dehydrogenase E2 component (dihydrolipoamide acetyltransferase)
MAVSIAIPKATISMEEGNLLRWLRAEGDNVAKDDLLFELETDKAVLEVPAPAEGTLLRIIVPQGTVRPEQIVGWIGRTGESLEDSPSPRASTPAARRRAAELGVDLAAVGGSGPNGRITREDVDAAASRAPGPRGPLVEHLAAAWREVPHIHIGRHMDAAGIAEARSARPDVSITDLLLYLVSHVLPDFPELTSVWRGGQLTRAEEIAVSLALDTDRGVVAPVIPGIAHLDIEAIARARQNLTELARQHRLAPEHLAGGVFTVTNLGMEGADFFAPVVNAPQTAILAVGRVSAEPVIAGGTIAAGHRVWMNLALDHRAADGRCAARFLERLQVRIAGLPQEIGRTP